MRAALSTTPIDRSDAELLVVPVAATDAARSDTVRLLDHRCDGRLGAEVRRTGFRGGSGQELVYQTHGAAPPAVIVLARGGRAPTLAARYPNADAVNRH